VRDIANFDNRFAGFLDSEKAGVAGHSFGGFTSLASAGAPISISNLKRICPGLGEFKLGGDQESFSGYFQCQATNALGMQVYNDEVELGDRRIKACFAMSPPLSNIFGESGENLGRIMCPIMLGGGELETRFQGFVETGFGAMTPPKFMFTLVGADHFSFVDAQRISEMSEEDGYTKLFFKVARDATIPDKNANYAAQAIGVAFFLRYLKGDQRYASYLNGDYFSVLASGHPVGNFVSEPE
jgi:predicted dienelactone hydrolase